MGGIVGNLQQQITMTLGFMSLILRWFFTIFLPRKKKKQKLLITQNDIDYLIYL